jgi:phytoene synthase
MSGAAAAAEVTRASGSNLALAFFCLSKEKRRDMNVFYAFCRAVDDIADDIRAPVEVRRKELEGWRASLREAVPNESAIAPVLREMLVRRHVPLSFVEDILAGMEMDLVHAQPRNQAELEKYCYHVAGAVGLVSVRIFGCEDADADAYAVKLGLALQLTNILRDVGEDFRDHDRCYIPLEWMVARGLSRADLGKPDADERFHELWSEHWEWAARTMEEARQMLPAKYRSELRASEIMRSVYGRLLHKMRADNLRVVSRRYRLSRLEKITAVARALL